VSSEENGEGEREDDAAVAGLWGGTSICAQIAVVGFEELARDAGVSAYVVGRTEFLAER
jgi:hypothetical protein